MKSEILALLRKRDGFVSGQELCQRFGVSRTAVWKAVNQLKKEGYDISAVRNKGYLLAAEHELFGRNELESRMETRWAGRRVLFFDSLNSTNLRAKQEAENGADQGTLVVADMQTAGRGRRGRSWSSPPGTNAYFTLILKPEYVPDRAPMVTLVMAMAVAEGIRETCGAEAFIKWPNDIVIDGRKVCGILTEMSTERDYIHHVVVGAGINVGRQDFPPEIQATAVCLEEICGREVSRTSLIVNVMRYFEEYYDRFCETADLSRLQEAYNRRLINRDREIRVLDPRGAYDGVSRGINGAGELLVELGDGSRVNVYAGEVSVRGVYGYT